MFCKNCGEYITNGRYCSRCDHLIEYSKHNNGETVADEIEVTGDIYEENNKSSFGLNILSFILPFVGIVLYFINKRYMPKKAYHIMRSLLLGCITYIAVGIAITGIHSLGIDIFSIVQSYVMGDN